jgi:glyoxylase-like metal-dependent hydrolase (beta-lactamase superfamily II)
LEWHHQKDEGAVAAAASLRLIASMKPTLILPEHGEPIVAKSADDATVQASLLETAELVGQLGAAKNYDAFTKSLGSVPEYRFLASEQVGTANPQGNPVPWTRLSPHLYLSGNTYALASRDGPVLLMDPYSQNIVERVADLKRDYGVGPVELAMISHAHNDHYTGIFALPDRQSFQVWTLNRIAQVVDAPHHFLAPYVDARAPKVDRSLKDGEVVRWHEYELKIHHLPGQTIFGMGLEVQIDGKKCLFTGDNFYHHDQYTGSGGWSGRNRGLPAGYQASAQLIIEMRPDWILAEHGGAFEFHAEDFRRRREFAVQAGAMADRLSRGGDHRIDWDPQRVRVEPLIVPAIPGATIRCQVAVDNPSKREVRFAVQIGRRGLASKQTWDLVAPAESTSTIDISLGIPNSAPAGRMVIPFIVEGQDGLDPSDAFVVLDIQSPASR